MTIFFYLFVSTLKLTIDELLIFSQFGFYRKSNLNKLSFTYKAIGF